MGIWGTAISSNDIYADIYESFFDLYNEGLEVSLISQKLIDDNQDIINDSIDCNNLWFALAKAQWECKQLDNELLDRIRQIIKSGSDLQVWLQLDADKKDIKKRKVVLDKFLAELQTDKPKAKSRKKKVIRQPVFEKGDCLSFKFANGNYGGAVVLEAIKNTEYGYNLIATTRINQTTRPSKKDFENAEVLLINYSDWDNAPNIQWYLPSRHKNIVNLIYTVDKIDVQLHYEIKNSIYSFMADFEIWIIEVADQQFKSEETKHLPKLKQTIKELTKKSELQF